MKPALPATFALCVTVASLWAAPQRPNIVLILADDLGYAEQGCYGNTFNETPALDALAARGVRFTSAYAAQTVSSPTRAALMTGLYPQRTGIVDYLRPDDAMHLDEAYLTLPEALKTRGYTTGIIGKWHLTGYTAAGAPYESSPDKHGFDFVALSEKEGIAGGSYFYPYHFNKDIEKAFTLPHEFLVDRMNAEAVDYIARQDTSQPFFLYLSHYAVHTNVHGKPEDVAHFAAKPGVGHSGPTKNNKADDPYVKWPSDFMAAYHNPHLAAQLLTVDRGVAMIVDELKRKGLHENTVIVFMSDNGGEARVTSNAPLRDGKSSLYEGGVRVSLIVAGPGVARGVVTHAPTVTYDLYPTFCQMAGAKMRGQRPDGISRLDVLQGKPGKKRGPLFWHYPLDEPHFLGGRSCGTVRDGDWKLLEFFDTGERQLYNLRTDIGEEDDVIEANPAVAAKLQKQMEAWRKEVGAVIKPAR